MPFTPTPEQSAIVDFALNRSESLLISALAGAAKTSTLELICRALPNNVPVLSLAFNKRIAEEMSKRLPGNVYCATVNSIGHRVWSAAIGKRLVVSTRKSFELLSESLGKRRGVDFSETLRAIAQAKLQGYIPDSVWPDAKRLISRDDFFSSLDEDIDPDLLNTVLIQSIKASFAGSIDFDDQVFMPTCFGGTWPRYNLVLVDEVQDLSPLNIAMLEKLVTRRIIAVGDRFQSVYGFRGAHSQAMSVLQSRFSMTELPLSISFRCPISVAKRAHFRAPSMRWPDWAIEGTVEELVEWSASTIPDGAAVICRNNAPLFRLAMRLIKDGRGVKLVGTDLGPGMIKALKKLGPETMNQTETLDAIDRWESERLRRSRAKASVSDKADCLRVFASFGDTLSAAIAYAEHLFSTSGPIQLLSGHKAKGLEWDVVYFLDPWRIPTKYAETPDELEQEENIRYVITTRAKRELYYVNLEDLT